MSTTIATNDSPGECEKKDFIICLQISKLLDSKGESPITEDSLLYDSPDRVEGRDELYGQIINGPDTSEKKLVRPKMALPEIGKFLL